ncbi:MAG: hypothetical protein HYW70_01505, partial [Candidatus Nealsonbacteria bacterium]|nr:hypothetical protein [Candidatus Nealsonbacteria bacterium]
AEPSQSPPLGNVFAPLNVGNVGQSKAGGLILNTGGAEFGLIVDKGKVQTANDICSNEFGCLGSMLDFLAFGSGGDGDAVISSNTVLERDMEYNNLTVNSGAVLDVNGHKIKLKGILTNQGSITDTFFKAQKGGNGGYGGNYDYGSPTPAGIGGAGGGIVDIYAKKLNNLGAIQANGQNGSNGSNTNSSAGGGGGGGGGSGGTVKLIYKDLLSLGTIEAKGGLGGLGGSGGNNFCPSFSGGTSGLKGKGLFGGAGGVFKSGTEGTVGQSGASGGSGSGGGGGAAGYPWCFYIYGGNGGNGGAGADGKVIVTKI